MSLHPTGRTRFALISNLTHRQDLQVPAVAELDGASQDLTKAGEHSVRLLSQVGRMEPQMKDAPPVHGLAQSFKRPPDAALNRQEPPETVHWEVDCRPRNIPQSRWILLRQDNRRRGCNGHFEKTGCSPDDVRQTPDFVPNRLRPSVAFEAVLAENIKMAYLVPRKCE